METKYLILKKFSKTISQNIIIIVIFKYHITKDIISTKDMMHDEVICITVFRKKDIQDKNKKHLKRKMILVQTLTNQKKWAMY